MLISFIIIGNKHNTFVLLNSIFLHLKTDNKRDDKMEAVSLFLIF